MKVEKKRKRIEQSFTVKKNEIIGNNYDLSLKRYREIEHKTVEHTSPQKLISELKELEIEIQAKLKELEGVLK